MYKTTLNVFAAILFFGFSTIAAPARGQSLQINFPVHNPFRFVAYGDTRFTDPANTKDTNPEIRQELVRAIAAVRPAFICFGGDIPFNGFSTDDWKASQGRLSRASGRHRQR
jgi:hypothetical protein